jgi:hypothetical protein
MAAPLCTSICWIQVSHIPMCDHQPVMGPITIAFSLPQSAHTNHRAPNYLKVVITQLGI